MNKEEFKKLLLELINEDYEVRNMIKDIIYNDNSFDKKCYHAVENYNDKLIEQKCY